MARVTVGVPVYNGVPYIGEALENLRLQTFRDFAVHIYDNASTDGTAETALHYVRIDPRFHYFRHETNIGSLPNFIAVLASAESEYFLWRAMDDGSDADYIEQLVGLLDTCPDRDLAVSRIETYDLDGKQLRVARVPDIPGRRGLQNKFTLLFKSHPSWIYGVFRRQSLLDRASFVLKEYKHPWAWDHLTILPFLLDNKVVGTNSTAFRQMIKRSAADRGRKTAVQQVAILTKLRQRFLTIARNDMSRRSSGSLALAGNEALLWVYVGKRVYRWRRLVRRRIIENSVFGNKNKPANDEKAGFEAYF